MITDLSLNTQISDVFLLKNKEFKVRRDKKTIDMFFKIADKTGEIEAINWDQGYVSKKKSDGTLQVTISSLAETAPLDLDYSDYLPQSKENLDELMQNIFSTIDSIENHHLKKIII